jgi:competence protein ComEA
MQAAAKVCSLAQGEVEMLKKIAATAVTLLTSVTWAQVELNQASEIELDGLKGLGPTMTRQIMDERQQKPFRDWPDVMQRIQGIGTKKAASLSEQGLRVQGQAYAPAPRSPAKKP